MKMKTADKFFLEYGAGWHNQADLMAVVGGTEVKLGEVDSEGNLDFEEIDFLNEIHEVDFISQEMLDEATAWYKEQSDCNLLS